MHQTKDEHKVLNTHEIDQLETNCIRTGKDLPEDIFLFFSRHVPMVNIDLLIRDEYNRTLLSWRDDKCCGTGWHIPGGVIRFKETIQERIAITSIDEIGTEMSYDSQPILIKTHIEPQITRGHFISMVFRCFLPDYYVLPLKEPNVAGYLKWHDKCPDNIIKMHVKYRDLINGKII